jgi:predicted dienelactone hydrolase/ABC-type amino acid transport substrate-binding protein
MIHVSHQWLTALASKLRFISATFGIGTLLSGLGTLPAFSAERLTTFIGPLQLSVPVDALETYAEDGTASGDLRLILGFLDDDAEAQLRQLLQHEMQSDLVALSRVFQIGMADQVLQSIGNTIQTDSGLNGFYAVRSATLLTAANHPDGWTLIDWMRQYPTNDIRISLGAFLQAVRDIKAVFLYQDAAAQVVIDESLEQAAAEPDFAYDQLPDLSEPGPYSFRKEQLVFDIQSTRTTLDGFAGHFTLRVDMYIPEGAPEPTPIVIYTHGWGGRLGDGRLDGEHLASYGFTVAVPEHIGTTDTYRSLFLAGGRGDLTSPTEYVSRQQDIIFMLDELEKLEETDPAWQGRIDPQQVGIIGQSFGALTVLGAAGASFNPARLRDDCSGGWTQLNPAFLLQCHARFLPPTEYDFTDPRIRAAIPQYPMGATIFGPEGMANVEIPILMLAGTRDILAPSVYEQIPLFSWMDAPNQHLALMVPGTHFSTSPPQNEALIPEAIRGPDFAIGRSYIRNLSVAFFKTHLSDDPENSEFAPYLTASFGQELTRRAEAFSEDENRLYILDSLTPGQLADAYGGTAPGSDRLVTQPDAEIETYGSVLEDLEETGVLRVGIRSEAPPFGYINQQSEWTGFCFDMAKQFVQYLAEKESLMVDLIAFPSNLENRFEIVQQGAVHLECGPNTIRSDIEDVTFTEPFYTAALKLLTTPTRASSINLGTGLADLQTGVLSNTTTQQFVQEQYPRTTLVPFETIFGRENAIQALADGSIDVFASDAILSVGEILRQGQSLDNFALVPETPLSCEFYGLVLPEGDRAWRTIVNNYLRSEPARLQRREFAGELGEESVANLEFCFR